MAPFACVLASQHCMCDLQAIARKHPFPCTCCILCRRFLYTRFDVQGGLQQLESYYHDEVESFFKEVEAIHIAALVLTVIMMLGFLLVILRPFLNKVCHVAMFDSTCSLSHTLRCCGSAI